jgi:hypothetical protein
MNSKWEVTPEEMARQIDAKTDELFDEFEGHAKECRSKNPEMTDTDVIMRMWMLQKIAGLQCLVLKLVERVAELERKR